MEHGSELHTDDTGTDNGKAFGEGIEIQKSGTVNHARVVNALDGKPLCFGACSDDDIGGGVFAVCRYCVRTNGTGTVEPGMATHQCDIGMREDALDPLTELGDNLCHSTTGLFKGGAMDEGLRRYAPYIETRATHVAALKDNHLQPLLSSILSGTVATGACANDNQVRFRH